MIARSEISFGIFLALSQLDICEHNTTYLGKCRPFLREKLFSPTGEQRKEESARFPAGAPTM
jgi:hypothetical protein